MSKIFFKQAETPVEIVFVKKMRFQIFTLEQGIPHELDDDGDDEQSIHVLGLEDQTPVASGRLTIDGSKGVLSRIAVDQKYRGLKLGQQVVRELEQLAKTHNVETLSLSPHAYLEQFYADPGYQTEPGEKHVGKYTLLTMTKKIA